MHRPSRGHVPHSAWTAVAEVVRQLAVLPAHDVGAQRRTRSGSPGEPPPAPRRRRRCRPGSGRHRGCPVQPRSVPARHRCRDERSASSRTSRAPGRTSGPGCARWPRRSGRDTTGTSAGRGVQVAGGRLGVLALRRQHDHVVAAPGELPRVGVRRDPQRHPLLGRLERQAALADHLAVGTRAISATSCPDWWRRAPMLAADPARSQHHHTHAASLGAGMPEALAGLPGMTLGAWVLLTAVVVAVLVGAWWTLTNGVFRGTRRVRGATSAVGFETGGERPPQPPEAVDQAPQPPEAAAEPSVLAGTAYDGSGASGRRCCSSPRRSARRAGPRGGSWPTSPSAVPGVAHVEVDAEAPSRPGPDPRHPAHPDHAGARRARP